MATYNGRHFIEEQLNSIFPQLSEHDELIISDDHSNRWNVEFLLELEAKDSRIKLFRNNGQGLIANFANAIEKSAHSIIFLSDQDDVWLPDKVKKQCLILIILKHRLSFLIWLLWTIILKFWFVLIKRCAIRILVFA